MTTINIYVINQSAKLLEAMPDRIKKRNAVL